MLGLTLAKPGGGRRELAIPSVRDRVLQTAFTQVLSPILEPRSSRAATPIGIHFIEQNPGGLLLATSPHPALLPTNRLENVMNENETSLPGDPPVADAAESVEPLLRSLYVTGHGSRLGIAGERFVVKPLEADEHEVPALKVDLIILFGHVQASTQALHYCFKHGIPVLFASVGGELHGLLDACGDRFTQRQKLQFIAAEDAAFSLELARAMVLGKIANSRTVLQRYARRHEGETVMEQIEELSALAQHAQSAAGLDQLRGFEGSAARAYFDGWRGLLPAQWSFDKREKHPATDPVNALLNLGYSLCWYPQCRWCARQRQTFGTGEATQDLGYTIV